MNFSEDVQRLQRSYYCGKMDRPTAIAMMDALMHEYKMLDEEERLVDIPDDFGKHFEETGFLGEFTVQVTGSPYKWKRSYADRVSPQKVKLFTEPPPYSLAPQPQRRIAGQHRWVGPVGKRKQVFVSVLSEGE